MWEFIKNMSGRTVKGTNLNVESGTIMESYTLNPSRSSITLVFPDMTCEIEDDFDIKEYIKPIPFLKKGYIHEQENMKHQNRREEVAVILKYLKSIKSEYEGKLDNTVISFLTDEIKTFENEFNKLTILESSDKEIIQCALVDLATTYLAKYADGEISNKINDVRDRYLKMVDNYHEKESEA